MRISDAGVRPLVRLEAARLIGPSPTNEQFWECDEAFEDAALRDALARSRSHRLRRLDAFAGRDQA